MRASEKSAHAPEGVGKGQNILFYVIGVAGTKAGGPSTTRCTQRRPGQTRERARPHQGDTATSGGTPPEIYQLFIPRCAAEGRPATRDDIYSGFRMLRAFLRLLSRD